MCKFILLTKRNGKKVLINTSSIAMVNIYDDSTSIDLNFICSSEKGENKKYTKHRIESFFVEEPFDHVCKLLK